MYSVANASYASHIQKEKPIRVLKALYIGQCDVGKAKGIDIINGAIDEVTNTSKYEQSVIVSVTASVLSINLPERSDPLIECRIGYLSYLGMGENVKNCAFITQTELGRHVAHVFHCAPSSLALCRAIEAACKVN
jgi:amyloid beta A4 precursor protein-binding family B member 2